MEKTEAGARKKAPLHDLHQDQVDAGRYRTVRAYVLGCDDLELERDSLEEENEDLRDMLNDIAYRLGLGDEVHYYSGDNYGICQEAVLHAIGCRMMPPGIEWPRFDDGEPVGIGSETDALRVDEIRFGVGDADGCTLYQVGPDGLNDRVQAVAAGERVKRSEPKALDAEGVEIRARDHVWHVETGQEYVVVSICYEDVIVVIRAGDKTSEHEQYAPSLLTHRAPVLAADGKPPREGETVYDVKTGEAFEVMEVYPGTTEPDFPGHTVKCRKIGDVGYVTHMFKPSQLTHERPDSWERLEEDASKQPYGYCVEHGLFIDPYDGGCTTPTNELFARDLVRRAKALAERDA